VGHDLVERDGRLFAPDPDNPLQQTPLASEIAVVFDRQNLNPVAFVYYYHTGYERHAAIVPFDLALQKGENTPQAFVKRWQDAFETPLNNLGVLQLRETIRLFTEGDWDALCKKLGVTSLPYESKGAYKGAGLSEGPRAAEGNQPDGVDRFINGIRLPFSPINKFRDAQQPPPVAPPPKRPEKKSERKPVPRRQDEGSEHKPLPERQTEESKQTPPAKKATGQVAALAPIESAFDRALAWLCGWDLRAQGQRQGLKPDPAPTPPTQKEVASTKPPPSRSPT
jgi:hypothetical protein